jgi:hypothetical protein
MFANSFLNPLQSNQIVIRPPKKSLLANSYLNPSHSNKIVIKTKGQLKQYVKLLKLINSWNKQVSHAKLGNSYGKIIEDPYYKTVVSDIFMNISDNFVNNKFAQKMFDLNKTMKSFEKKTPKIVERYGKAAEAYELQSELRAEVLKVNSIVEFIEQSIAKNADKLGKVLVTDANKLLEEVVVIKKDLEKEI